MREPILEHYLKEEQKHQKIYRFANGYGVSIAKSPTAYGGCEGGWSFAVIGFYGPLIHQFDVVEGTEVVPHDILAEVPDDQIDGLLARVEKLPSNAKLHLLS